MEVKTFKEWRKDKGITAIFIAKKLGISTQSLYNKEEGKSGFSWTEGRAYCKLLGISDEQVKD